MSQHPDAIYVPKIDNLKELKQCVSEGFTLAKMAEHLGKSQSCVRKRIIKFGLYQEWKTNKQKKISLKEKKNEPKKMKALMPILEEAERRGYSVEYGTGSRSCKIQGLKISLHHPKRMQSQSRGKYIYILVYINIPEKLHIVILPNGKKYFILPMLRYRKKTSIWRIRLDKIDEKEKWPTKTEIKKHKKLFRLVQNGYLDIQWKIGYGLRKRE